jgi:hypothetical protein
MEGPPLGAGEGAGSKRKREKEEKKRKKREKKERKKEKKRRKKEKKREKKKRKKEKKAARKGESSSSSSGSDDSSSDEGPERGEVPPFDPAAFERVVRDVLFVNPAMKAALKQVMLALDSGTGINLAGLQNPAVKRSLQNVFDVLPLMAHRNGERSLPKASGMSAHALLSETIEKIESRAAPGATAPGAAAPGATAAPTAVTQFNEDEDDGEGFGPQLSTSGNLREGRAFTEEEMERAKAAASSAKAGKLHSGGGVKRGAWMTELPKGRDVFSQATSSKGSRQFMQRTVERTLATDQEVNMWTATPKQRQELQAKEADRVLLGYGAQPTRGGGGGGSSSPSSAKLEQARAEAVSAKFYRGGAASAVAAAKPPKAGEEGGVTRTWDRERDLLNGSVDTNHLNAVVKGASKMGSRFASSQRLE